MESLEESPKGFNLLWWTSFGSGAYLTGGSCSSLGEIISNCIGVLDSRESNGDGGGVGGMS